jgi:hypothetical protein
MNISLDGVRTRRGISLKAMQNLLLLDGKYNEYRSMAFVLDGVSLKAIEKLFCSMANKINIDRW